MSVFTKNKKSSSEIKDNMKSSEPLKHKVKKKKIGFGKKHKKNQNEDYLHENQEKKIAEVPNVQTTDSHVQLEQSIESKKNFENEKDFLEEMLSEEKIISEETVKSEKREEWSKSKRKALIKKDMKGKPVFLEDTGEKIGNVFDSIYDRKGDLVGYKIKDNKSESILSFSLDQFGEDKGGLIFVPSWYTKGVKTIEKLEFKDRISPELTWLLKDHTITEEELYNIFVKHDDIIANYMKESATLRELISSRLKILERERLTLKEDLMDLTEKRLIKDIDRRKFSEVVMQHRRKVTVLDVNIKKCKELLKRLEQTSFGILSSTISLKIEKKSHKHHNKFESTVKNDIITFDDNEKSNINYIDFKTEYDELQEENNSLKSALETKIENPYEDKYQDLKQSYEELKLDAEHKIKEPYQDRYNKIKTEYNELYEECNNLKSALETKIENPYEDKYNDLTQNYEELLKEYKDLSEEHDELKVAVEKILHKDEA